MDVELRHLRVLVAVDEERSFTAAADRLRMSQAAVSRSLAALEHEVGTALMHRTTRRVEPTEAGAALTGTARRVLAELDRALADLRGEPSVIRVGYAWAALGAHTTPVLRAWNRAHPDSPMRLVRINSRDAGLVEGRVDLAVLRHPLDRTDLEGEVVGRERRVVAMPVDHPLAEREAVDLAELVPFVVAVDPRAGTTTPTLWQAVGADVPPMTDTADVEEWLDLIAAGDAIGVTSEATAHHYPRPGVVFVPLADAPPMEVRLAWHRTHRHPAAGRVARAIREALAEPSAPAR
ncbi:DNA-binding transcriptional LysR family regulator [Agromyces flavus]|uniref:DNA-binding transcriptional LysR family regulator n=1 Tax=Agromyces flavus TaxID=589382 RepID=A0A1H1NSN4_9MICO|nr:LysR family transcriptional regulator [Agromyces flavus]MCP2368049.1 DNA-binding transcriptional LysR family regulator [Agromyces flavus]GGI47511.1 LysR family transcriptional regulator [Agromyces flavus]SDS01996.1 DNA-binding transcriptional regulator, LysR family [Agromyces flavus]